VAGDGAAQEAFRERPTAPIVPDAYPLAALPAILALGAAGLGAPWIGAGLAGIALFVLAFFRNPARAVHGDDRTVVAPADGRVIAVGEVEDGRGRKGVRVGIFLSVFDVHVNRAPVAGRVVSLERGGRRFLAAYDARAVRENVRLARELELADGRRVLVTQIAGWVARRIVCHPQPGQWLPRGARYGLIRFGSRTDVLLPPGTEVVVRPGQRVRGGASVLARLAEVS
jgi:phosphatidylserine decarboxylase